jgi:hypothetical protein
MMNTEAGAPLPGTLQSAALGERARKPWIESAAFDLSFFILSPLIAIPLLIVSPTPTPLSIVFACMLGIPHYLSTFTFFFWEDTVAEHRAKWPLFFGVPVIIVLSIGLALFFRIPYIVQVVVYVWNVYHVGRQSCGIQSIYRMNAGVKDPSVRAAVNPAIMWTSAAMAFWSVDTHPPLHSLMTMVWDGVPRAVFVLLAVLAFVSLIRLADQLRRRFRSSEPPQAPEMMFLGTSLLLFHPYLWIADSNMATLGMLLGHFIQYLAIVWLVHRRKFAALAARGSRTLLTRVSTNLPLLLVVLVSIGGLALTFNVGSRLLDVVPAQVLYSGGFLSIALVHFYLDGLFWAMRRPEVRRSLSPYLTAVR